VHRLIRRLLRNRDRPQEGAHAAAFTPAGKLILDRLRYAAGWRLPGGGQAAGESLETAALRELREEIGMLSHGAVASSAIPGVLIVRDVRYRPRKWAWEVEGVREADAGNLPPDLSPRTSRWLRKIAGEI
jgi:ADP-ribose pyrophosphatase YjhB (NUDIX family)